MKCLRWTTWMAVAALLLTQSASAALLLYEDNFDGTGSASLNTLAPDFAVGTHGASATATWSAHTSMGNNGVPANATDASALLPLDPEADKLYILTVVATVGAGVEDNDWLGFGFNAVSAVSGAGTNPVTNAGRFTDTGQQGKVWAIAREAASNGTNDQDVQLFSSVTSNQLTTTETDASFNGLLQHTYVLQLDTTAGVLTASLSVDGVAITSGFQPVVGVALADINGVGITHNNTTQTGVFFDSFKLEVIPEPSSVALAGLALVGLVAAARRRN